MYTGRSSLAVSYTHLTLPSVLGRVGLRSGRSPERGSASRDVGRRRVASTAVRRRRSLIHRPFSGEKSRTVA